MHNMGPNLFTQWECLLLWKKWTEVHYCVKYKMAMEMYHFCKNTAAVEGKYITYYNHSEINKRCIQFKKSIKYCYLP